MREGIHPDYHQATVTCNCGSAPSAIRSIQDSRKRLRHVAVLISSTRNTVLNKKQTQQAEVESISASLF